MKFIRVYNELKGLEQKNELTMADLFAVFRDLCDDVRDVKTLSSVALGDEELLIRNIPLIGRQILRYYSSVEQKQAQLNESIAERRTKIEELSLQCEQLEQQLNKLKAVYREQSEKEADYTRLLNESEQIKRRITQLSEIDVPAMERETKELKSACEVKQMEYKALLAQHIQLEEKETKLTEVIRNTKNQIRDKETALNQKEAELYDAQSRFTERQNELEEARQKTNELRKALMRMNSELADERKKNETFQESLDSPEKKALLQEMRSRYIKLESEREKYLEEYNEADRKLNSCTAEMMQLKAKREEKESQLAKCRAESETLSGDLKQLNIDYESEKKKLDDIRRQMESEEIEKRRDSVELLKTVLGKLEEDKRSLKERFPYIHDDDRLLMQELDDLKKRIDKCMEQYREIINAVESTNK